MTSKKQQCKQKGKFPNQFIDLDLNKKQIGFFFHWKHYNRIVLECWSHHGTYAESTCVRNETVTATGNIRAISW